jgi:hypothetical protein
MLARKLGMTRQELLERMDVEEFQLWKAYAAKRTRAYQRAAMLKKELKDTW